jgi:predicted Rdx family selenoprotein
MLRTAQPDEMNETVLLAGDGGGTFELDAKTNNVTVTVHDTDAGAPGPSSLRGVLPDVVDSLVGRGRELTEVLHGPRAAVEQLGVLRAFMLLPVAEGGR